MVHAGRPSLKDNVFYHMQAGYKNINHIAGRGDKWPCLGETHVNVLKRKSPTRVRQSAESHRTSLCQMAARRSQQTFANLQ